jgi:hypothetical protein
MPLKMPSRNNKMCFKCDVDLQPGEKKFMVACEVPYVNIYFCWKCKEGLGDDIYDFLQENSEKIVEYSQI